MENKENKKKKVVNGKEYEIKPEEYYKNFKLAHPEKEEKIICPICYGQYNYYSKSRHKKSKRHVLAESIKNPIPTDTEKSSDTDINYII